MLGLVNVRAGVYLASRSPRLNANDNRPNRKECFAMRTNRCPPLLLVFTAVLALIAGQAQAVTEQLGVNVTRVWDSFEADRMAGYEFRVNSTITVTRLGVYDSAMDGLTNNHQVGLWTAAGSLLGSTTVHAGTVDPLFNYFRFGAIQAVVLDPGNYVVAASMPYPGDPQLYNPWGNSPPEVSWVTARLAFGDTFTFPTQTNPNYGYFGGNIMYAVPEPGMLSLLAVGALLAVKRRRAV